MGIRCIGLGLRIRDDACKSKIEDSAVLKDWELAVLGWDWGIGGLGMHACKSKIEDSRLF